MAKYTISLSGDCGGSGMYGTNMWNVNGNQPTNTQSCGHPSPCNGCVDTPKGSCVLYTGANKINTGINKYDTLDTIIGKLDAIKAIHDTKFTNALLAINDLNTRLNALESGTDHAPYSLL